MLCSKTNDNPIAILLTYSTVRVLLAGDAEASEGYMVGPLPGIHTRRSRVARHDRWRHPPVLKGSQFDFDLLPQSLPQPTPTSSDSDRHAPTRILRKSLSVRASSDMNRRTVRP